MRVVLDTNVLIAAFIARGVCADLLEHCLQQHAIVLSEPILAELHEKLAGKFKYSADDAQQTVDLLRAAAQIAEPSALPAPICRDPDDDVILATAISGGVECIVTGDDDLLVLGEYEGIRIIRPAEFAAFENGLEAQR